MKLIIVESPTKARTLAKFLGSDYQIEATMGHLRDLPERNLGVEIITNPRHAELVSASASKEKRILNQVQDDIKTNYEFIPTYETLSKKKETIAKLKNLAKKAEAIILATDPDREGEAIAWHVGELLKLDTRNLKLEKNLSSNLKPQDPASSVQRLSSISRIVFHEITESAIKEALAHPGQIEMNLVWAQQARRILDRLVGYKLSPVLWRKIRRGLSAGRVQSVTVRLIVEREREIKAFKAEEYWEIKVKLSKTVKQLNSGTVVGKSVNSNDTITTEYRSTDSPLYRSTETTFLANLISRNNQKLEIKNKDEAGKIVSELQKAIYSVKSVETSELRKYPYPPFTTSTLQQTASNLFGWSAKQTMRVAQRLYEEGLITYHRTDSLNLAGQAVTMCRDFIKKEYGVNYLPDAPKFYKTKSKVAQEAHEAIRPTSLSRHAEFSSASDQILKQVQNDKILDPQEERLYTLIWKRFVACQMSEAVFEQTKVEVSAQGVIPTDPAKGGGVEESSEARLRPRSLDFARDDNAIYLFRSLGSKLKFDGWKKLYAVSNRAIEQSSNEESEENKTLPPLTVGELLNLLKLIPSQHFTQAAARYTEASLIKALEEKGIGRPSTYAPIITTIQARQYVEKAEKKFSPTVLGETVNDFLVKNFPKELDYEFTAKMEDDLDEIANGQKQWQPVLSEFYGPFSKKVEEVSKDAPRSQVPVEKTGEKCEKCGSPMIIRIGRFGKFLACSAFPKCKNTKPLVVKTDLKCPKCAGDIVLRKTKRGRHFYGCQNYPKCSFAAWKKEDIK